MGFFNIAGLTALICLPIIIILYMLRPKNIPYSLPSLYLWKMMSNEIESASQFQKLKSSLLMFLQLAIALLIAFMLAGLFIKNSQMPDRVILVVDCSVSMKSTDIEPTRMEYAKEQAITYIKQLNKEAQVTLISLKDIPEILLTDETDHSLVASSIKDLSAIDAYSDINLALQATAALKKDEGTTIVYFGDRAFPGAENVVVSKDNNNIAVHNIAYTIYTGATEMRVLADITNESETKVHVPISLYADELFLDAKQVEIEPHESAKVFFDKVPLATNELKVQIDREDNLVVDNIAYTTIAKEQIKKAVLVTGSNVFLEKVFKLNKGIELYQAEPKDIDTLKGFDLYIFDGVLPTTLPTDGAILLFDPPENTYFEVLGYAENPELFSAGHEITTHLNKPDFAIGSTQIYEVPTWADDVLDTEYGVCAFAGTYHGVRIVTFGFDLHSTDLPLVVDFPILMTNAAGYLIPNSMLYSSSIPAGEGMGVRILPNTEEAYVLNPEGLKEHLDISNEETLYKNTNSTGLYTLVQVSSEKETIERFGVNVPLRAAIEEENSEATSNKLEVSNKKSLFIILGMVVLVITVAEWFIYHYRRKINAIKL
ncbi:MAG: hypothetical protein CVU84_15425 [Firmicutes bacterium HGW-Firmicutes-1]|jgi:hypothetical protein|nr:MAG: hypothetical protein CVU84_15425 [Firmicutes bacterium HGW-Firmicutes-1]